MANIDKSSAIYKEYMKQAHRADQRLLRLERLQKEAYYAGVTEFGYAQAQRSIYDLGGKTSRFRAIPIKTEEDLIKAQARVTEFLGAKSSTKKGITSVYKKRAESFNRTMRERDSSWQDMTWQELADAWEYIENSPKGKPGYSMTMKSFNTAKKYGPEKLVEDFKKGNSVVKRIGKTELGLDPIELRNLLDIGLDAAKILLKVMK